MEKKSRKKRRSTLTPVDKEVVGQIFAVTGNQSETARRTGYAVATVRKVLQAQSHEDTPEVRTKRAEAAAVLAGKLHVKAEEIIDSITPEDLQSGRIAVHDAEGNVVRYNHYGPTLLQKASSAGMIADRANTARQFEQTMLEDHQSGALMLPEGLAGLRDAIGGKIKQLQILNVNFEADNPGVLKRTEEVVAEVAALESVAHESPEVEIFDEFDNP